MAAQTFIPGTEVQIMMQGEWCGPYMVSALEGRSSDHLVLSNPANGTMFEHYNDAPYNTREVPQVTAPQWVRDAMANSSEPEDVWQAHLAGQLTEPEQPTADYDAYAPGTYVLTYWTGAVELLHGVASLMLAAKLAYGPEHMAQGYYVAEDLSTPGELVILSTRYEEVCTIVGPQHADYAAKLAAATDTLKG